MSLDAQHNTTLFAVLEATRRELLRCPPEGVTKREVGTWWGCAGVDRYLFQ